MVTASSLVVTAYSDAVNLHTYRNYNCQVQPHILQQNNEISNEVWLVPYTSGQFIMQETELNAKLKVLF
jgi:hypothetical protein